jgi:hypothetical protein
MERIKKKYRLTTDVKGIAPDHVKIDLKASVT